MYTGRHAQDWDPRALRHSSSEIWVMSQVAAERGLDVKASLAELMQGETLFDRSHLVSFAQQIEVQQRLDLPTCDVEWAIDMGARLHASSYGLAGYALICSQTLEAALQLAIRLSPLLNLKHALSISASRDTARLHLRRGYFLESVSAGEYDILEQVKLMTLLRDIVGPDLRLRAVRVARQLVPAAFAAMRNIAGCPVAHAVGVTEIDLPAEVLRRPLPQRQALTCRYCTEACEQQLLRISCLERVSGRVRARLELSVASMPGIDAVARALCISGRSLRRRLEMEGTSFKALAEEVRRATAERLLATTLMSTEAIADATGYCDVANFRHAFKRWRGETPRQFRDRAQSMHGHRAAKPDLVSARDRLTSDEMPSLALVSSAAL